MAHVGWKGDLRQRLEAKSIPEPNSGCMLWLGATDTFGYGRLWDGKIVNRTHVVSYELNHGPVPKGMCVLHRCDVPMCSNPAHLFLGTKKQNTQDMLTKGRHRLKVLRGEDNGHAKLTADNVREIRKSTDSQWSLSRRFGVTQTAIWRIVHRLSWRHVCLVAGFLAISPPVALSQSYTNNGYCQMTSLATAKTIATANCTTGSVPSGAKYAEICVSTQGIRYTSTGATTPTATIGIPVPSGTCFAYSGNIYSMTIIQQAGGAIVDIEFFN